jgi:putative FmdB family regulatory protein
MPVYVYACASCAHGFETRQGFNECALTICPECGGTIRRVVQPVGIVFKGTGFYKNDSRRTTEVTAGSGERKPESAAAATDSSTPSTSTPASDGNAPAPVAAPSPTAASGESKSKAATTAPAT